jgi:PAS domain S-box-containing protein
MSTENRSKDQLIAELETLRKQLAQLESSGFVKKRSGQRLEKVDNPAGNGMFCQAIINSLPGILYVLNDQWKLCLWNENLEKLTEYSADEIATMHPIGFFEGKEEARVEKSIQQAFAEGKSSVETTLTSRSGKRIPLSLTGQRVRIKEKQYLVVLDFDIERRSKGRENGQNSQRLLEAINTAQSAFIMGNEPREVFGQLLDDILHLTDSGYGFMGDVLYTPDGQPYLRTHAITDISWNDETRGFFEENVTKGLEFSNLKTLFGQVMLTGKTVISNDPLKDPRAGGLPKGHPKLNAFLGLPFCSGTTMMGMVGLANRPGGYNEELITYLTPLVNVMANIITAHRVEQDRKNTEKVLKESEERFRTIFEDAMDGLVFISVETRKFVNCNTRFCEMLGYSPQEIKNLTMMDIHTEEDLPHILEEYEKLSKNEAVLAENVPTQRRGGTVFPADISLSTITVSGQSYLIGVYRDITNRKESEDLLKKSEEKYRALFETDLIGVALTDKRANIIDANRAFQKMLGYSREEFQNMSIKDITYADDLAENIVLFREAIEGRRNFYRMEKRYLRKDGSLLWGDLMVLAIYDEHGEFSYCFSMIMEITKRKKAEEALVKSEERYRAVVEDMPGMVCRFLPNGKLTFVNRYYCEYFNKTSEELIDQNFFQFIPESEQEEVRNHYLSLSRQCPMVTYEHRVIGSDGRIRWHQWTDRGLFGEEGAIAEYQSLGWDITEKKKLEEEMQRAQKLESIGILAAGIAHDFNNLLAAILGNVSLAKMYTDPDNENYLLLDQSEKASLRAKDLTQRLLTFSKGGSPIRKPISMTRLIKDNCSFILAGSNVKWKYTLSDDLWSAEVDEGQIGQVIQNLLINADQSMPEGGVVEIRAENTTVGTEAVLPLQQGKYVKIMIQDKGGGIQKEYLNRVFDPYFTTKQSGSGLGLTVAYSIIRNHAGYITVDSKLGVGTTFTLFLPASTKETPREISVTDDHLYGKGLVLVMDDEEMVRMVAGEILERIGYEVKFAQDGEEAVELYRQAMESDRPFDVVIADLTIPGGMGGKEMILKLLEIDPEAKAVVSSGYSNDAVMSDFRTYGFRDVLKKPFDVGTVAKTLQRVISEDIA